MAESNFNSDLKNGPGVLKNLSEAESQKALFELSIHQIELSLQNEELQLIQQELEKSQQAYYSLYENAPVGYCQLGAKGLILKANRQILEMLDLPRSEIIGKAFSDFIYSEDQDKFYFFQKAHSEALAPPSSCELRLKVFQKEMIWVQLTMAGDSSICSNTESRLIVSNIDRVKKSEEQLAQASRLAAMGSIAASIAGEVKFPLSIISNAVGPLVLQANHSEKFKSRAQSILSAVGKIAFIMNGLTRFSSSSNRNIATQHLIAKISRKFSLAKVVREACSFVKAEAERGGIEIQMQLDESLQVHGVEIDIEQVLISLLYNSIEALTTGAKVVPASEKWIRLETRSDDQGISLQITDAGRGISTLEAKNIFTPFYTTKGFGRGVGLGLPIARSILAENNATISLVEDSVPTSFRIEFPTLK